MQKIFAGSVHIALAALFTACLGPLSVPNDPNIFSLSLTLPDAAQDHYVGDDTLTVIVYKMLIDTIAVGKDGQEDEAFQPKLLLATHSYGFSDYTLVGSGNVEGGSFHGLRYTIINPGLQTNIIDPDLVERLPSGQVTETFSISVTGVYNRTLFRFRSKVTRAVQYDFLSSVSLPDHNSYLEARLRGNWKQWFLNTAGDGILDPADPANQVQIEENILKYFDIFTYTLGGLQ